MEMLGFDSDFSLLGEDQWDGHHNLLSATPQPRTSRITGKTSQIPDAFKQSLSSQWHAIQTHLWEMTGIQKPLLKLQVML